MKILLILAYDRTYRYQGRFKTMITYAPLTLTSLAALVPDEFNAQIDIVDEGENKPDYSNKNYDIVGISCVTAAATRAYALAEYWKKKGAYVVLGGSHPTLCPDEAVQYADSVVVGFGEVSWVELLYDYKNNTTKKIYKHNGNKPLTMPVPRRDLSYKGYMSSVPTIIANRGCRNNCSFCCIPKLCENADYKRPIEEVIEEIKMLNKKNILFLDPSPISDKDYAKQLFEALIPLNKRWAGLSTINIADDDELIDLMIRSGCAGTLIGFESFEQNNMKLCRKGFNKVSKYKSAVKKLHEHKIAILGCFVLGFDDDTVEGLSKMADIVEDIGVDLPRYAVLTPFPGTEMFEKLDREGRILSKDWSLYDCQHVIYQPKNMSRDKLQQIFYDTWKNSFTYKKMFRKLLRKNHINKLLSIAIEITFKRITKRIINNRNADYDISLYLD
jgi:radical SAM superfamily enzyme YgiQ (UPF0313 family)